MKKFLFNKRVFSVVASLMTIATGCVPGVNSQSATNTQHTESLETTQNLNTPSDVALGADAHNEQLPNQDDQTPVHDDQTPVHDDQTPVQDDQSPVQDDQTQGQEMPASANTAPVSFTPDLPSSTKLDPYIAYPYIDEYEIEAHIQGSFARVTTTILLRNPNRKLSAGTLSFPMPEGAVMNGFAIDIDGEMTEAVTVDSHNARYAYEKEMKKNIDPGLLEQSRGNVFSTRIFPLTPRTPRKVRISYTVNIRSNTNGDASLMLPMIKSKLSARNINITIDKNHTSSPTISGIEQKFTKLNNQWHLESKDQNITPQDDLIIELPEHPDISASVEKYERTPNESYFAVDILTGPSTAPKRDLSNLRIIWDASGSRKPNDIADARKILEQLPENSNFELHVFRNRLEKPRIFNNRNDLLNAIDSVIYDGGSDFQTLAELATQNIDGTTLMFTDGIDTYEGKIPSFGLNTYAIVSGQMRDINLLNHASSGLAFDLNHLTPEEIIHEISTPQTRVAQVKGKHISDIQGIGAIASGRITILGKLNSTTDNVTVVLSDGRKYSVKLSAKNAPTGMTLATAWAGSRVRELAPLPETNRQELLALGKKFNVVSPVTSLIVFESLNQWLAYDIEPPTSLTAIHDEWMKYKAQKQNRDKNKKSERASEWNIQIKSVWDNHIEWWKDPLPKNRQEQYFCTTNKDDEQKNPENIDNNSSKSLNKCTLEYSSDLGFHFAKKFIPPEGWKCDETNNCILDSLGSGLSHVSGSCGGSSLGGRFGAGGYGPAGESTPEQFDVVEANIDIQPWNPDVPYLNALKKLKDKGATIDELYAEYIKQKALKNNEFSSAFYFDIAEFFFHENSMEYAVRILSNLSEIRVDDPSLLRVYAWKLRNYKVYADSIRILNKIVEIRPHENISWHDLAFTHDLIARETKNPDDAEKSMNYYIKAALDPWDGHNSLSVALVSLEEFNALVAWIKRQKWSGKTPKLPKIAPEFIQLTDTDLRIVLNWDIDNTDIDLHVVEPSSELVYFSHQRSYYGGILSEDITTGYGPEEYLIKQAPAGQYTILTNYYSNNSTEYIGTSSIVATVYTNWGRPNQSQEDIVVRMDKPMPFHRESVESLNDFNSSYDSDQYYKVGTVTVK